MFANDCAGTARTKDIVESEIEKKVESENMGTVAIEIEGKIESKIESKIQG